MVGGLGQDRRFNLFHFPKRRWEPAWAVHFGAWTFGPSGRLSQSAQEKASTYEQGTLVTVSDIPGLTIPPSKQTRPVTLFPLGIFHEGVSFGAGAHFHL